MLGTTFRNLGLCSRNAKSNERVIVLSCCCHRIANPGLCALWRQEFVNELVCTHGSFPSSSANGCKLPFRSSTILRCTLSVFHMTLDNLRHVTPCCIPQCLARAHISYIIISLQAHRHLLAGSSDSMFLVDTPATSC